jgi:hypothetical protein
MCIVHISAPTEEEIKTSEPLNKNIRLYIKNYLKFVNTMKQAIQVLKTNIISSSEFKSITCASTVEIP